MELGAQHRRWAREVEPTNTPTLEEFQQQVSALLLRHRSLLDVMSKYNQSNAAVNRAVTKAVTDCGCIEINAKKQSYSEDLNQSKDSTQSHLAGALCEHCYDVLKTEMGRNIFYMTALCNLLDVQLDEVVANESKKCSTLGLFNMT